MDFESKCGTLDHFTTNVCRFLMKSNRKLDTFIKYVLLNDLKVTDFFYFGLMITLWLGFLYYTFRNYYRKGYITTRLMNLVCKVYLVFGVGVHMIVKMVDSENRNPKFSLNTEKAAEQIQTGFIEYTKTNIGNFCAVFVYLVESIE